ncbi:hypothetical protein JZ751_026748, partial [Albula glossodonta]
APDESYDQLIDCTSSAELGVAHAESPYKDGPLLQPLARSGRGERYSRFPNKLISVEKGRRSFQARGRDPTASRALMKMDSELLHSPVVGLAEEEEADMSDWNLPLAFMKKRHSEKIEGSKALAQSWRMKDRVRNLFLL